MFLNNFNTGKDISQYCGCCKVSVIVFTVLKFSSKQMLITASGSIPGYMMRICGTQKLNDY